MIAALHDAGESHRQREHAPALNCAGLLALWRNGERGHSDVCGKKKTAIAGGLVSALKKRSSLRRGFGFGRARSFGLHAFAFDVALASCALFHFVRLLAHRSLHSRCITFW
jgi:hypothetical protein